MGVTCLTCMAGGPECEGPVRSRGMCEQHYQAAHHDVQAGVTTWRKIEKSGLCLPAYANNKGRQPKVSRPWRTK